LGLAAGAALAGVALACKVARKEEKTEKEETPSPRCVFGELIDNDIHVLVTDPAGDNPPILRKNLSLDDSEEHWYVKAGVVVEGQKMTGPIYPTDESKLEYDGCGVWFKTKTPLEIYKMDKEGNLISQLDENGQIRKVTGYYIAGSFLRKPTEEELEKLKASS